MSDRKLALITGGSSGIGFGIAQALIANFDLAIAYANNDDKAQTAKAILNEAHPEAKVCLFKQDLSNEADCQSLVKSVLAYFGAEISVLVNSAGRLQDGIYFDNDFENHQKLINEHLLVPMCLSHLCIKSMYKHKFGRVINLSSISASRAKPGQVNYSAAKSGIEGFTRGLALEVAHRGVTVNAVAPGLIESPMTQPIINSWEEQGLKVRNKIPCGFLGTPSDVAGVVELLCSEKGRYITGQTITIDGGRSLGLGL